MPGAASGIPNDTAPSVYGFQGQYEIQFTVTTETTTVNATAVINVGAGFSVSGDLRIETATARLDIARIQQRLNVLGFTGQSQQPLAITGIADSETIQATKLFKAATFSTGELDVTEISSDGLFDKRLIRWLNSDNAPSWQNLPGLVNVNRFATDWLFHTLTEANGTAAGGCSQRQTRHNHATRKRELGLASLRHGCRFADIRSHSSRSSCKPHRIHDPRPQLVR